MLNRVEATRPLGAALHQDALVRDALLLAQNAMAEPRPVSEILAVTESVRDEALSEGARPAPRVSNQERTRRRAKNRKARQSRKKNRKK